MKEPEPVKLTAAEGEALIQRIKADQLKDEDRQVLEQLIHMYFWLLFVIQEAKLSLKRLKRLIFGDSNRPEPPTKPPNDPPTAPPSTGTSDNASSADSTAQPPQARDAAGRLKRGGGKPPGQGRQGADAYWGAERILCTLAKMQAGQRCLACEQLIGVPVADATQWDQIEQLAGDVWPVFNELVYQAA